MRLPFTQTRRVMASEAGGAGGAVAAHDPVPSVYRYRAGSTLVTAVHEGHNRVPLKQGFIRDVPLAEVQSAMTNEFLSSEWLDITFTPIVVETGGELVLIDTGLGEFAPPTAGLMTRNLAAAGFSREDITMVVISHFHGDHISGLRGRDGAEAFPGARVMVPEVEWDFWTDAARRDAAPEALKPNFENVDRVFTRMADRVEKYRWDDQLVPGLVAMDARGHTPGHTAFTIGSGEDRVIFISDVTNHPALFVRHPDWAPAFDVDPDAARATRHRILGQIADEGVACAGYHLPFPAVGHMARDGAKFRFVPSQWVATVST